MLLGASPSGRATPRSPRPRARSGARSGDAGAPRGALRRGRRRVAADLGDVDLTEQLSQYLADAHALEQQAIELLERASERDDGQLAAAYEAHLAETREHARLSRSGWKRSGATPHDEGRRHAPGRDELGTFFEATPTRRASSLRSPTRSSTSRSAATSS